MNKKPKHLRLNRETLRILGDVRLAGAQGAPVPVTAQEQGGLTYISWCAYCATNEWTWCQETECNC